YATWIDRAALQQSLKATFTEFLSTLKFTQPLNDKGSWSTHTNSEYNYEFRYPSGWLVDTQEQVTRVSPRSEIEFLELLSINGNAATIDQVEESYRMAYPNITRRSTTFAGKPAYSWTVLEDRFYRLYIPGGNNIEIGTNNYDLDLVKEILSTFNLNN